MIDMDDGSQSEDDPNKIDDEETGGEWVTDENLHKHLSHGVVLPLVPTTTEIAEEIKPVEIKEESKEEEDDNTDFPAFDETQLPSLVDLEAKQKQLGAEHQPSSDKNSEAATTQINTSEQPSGLVENKIKKRPHPIETREGSPSHVVFLTSDMAMQNVIIQMGFTLVTLDGFRLTRVKRFKLLCRACMKLNMEIERQYCEFCGAHVLGKVSVFINDDGELSYFDNPKRRINLRGTIYSLPKPKAGRHNKNMILREDQLMVGEMAIRTKNLQRAKKKEEAALENTMQGNYWAGGQGYGQGVSQLLYENGAKGGAKRHNN